MDTPTFPADGSTMPHWCLGEAQVPIYKWHGIPIPLLTPGPDSNTPIDHSELHDLRRVRLLSVQNPQQRQAIKWALHLMQDIAATSARLVHSDF